PITYTEAGNHEYTVKEVKETLPGIAYDETTYSVSVEVKDNGQGALEATVTYPDEGIVFTNNYDAQAVDVTLAGTKNLTGGKGLAAGMFNFTVEDSEGAVVATGTNDADGTIDFTSVTHNEAGTFQYSVKEETGSLPGITYDSTSHVVTVEVTDNGLGALEATVTYPEDGLVFHNTYSTDSINVAFSGKKVLTGGKELAEGMFDFTVEDSEGNAVATGTNNVIGNIDFTSITYTEAGTYHYTVKEVAGTLPGITYDETSYEVTVEVTDDGEGALVATITYPEDGIVFNNSYSTTSVDADFTGQKTLTGKELTEGMFDFVVKDEEGNQVSTGTNDADGKIDFTSITYTQPGVYEYTAQEVKGNTPGITYDTSVYSIKVTVVDNGLGSLVAEVSYVNGAINFENKYAEDSKDPTPPTKQPEDHNSKWNVTHVGSKNKGDKGKTSPVKTGDSTDILFLVSVSTLSLIALSFMIYRRRKAKED
ncbi:MAG TPA: hypothetical protein IAC41_12805, partial [Candidatus Merdenecus merdavium]|nr:hypothetical protein [Candidatus Merdenecus merdavium]